MTVPSTSRRAGPYTGNGATTNFPFSFKVFQATDIKVVKTENTVTTTLSYGSDYSVTLNPNQDTLPGGSLTLLSGPLNLGALLSIVGNLPYDQTTDLPTGGSYSSLAQENAFDRIVMLLQQLVERDSRQLSLPENVDPSEYSGTLPIPEPNSVIGWDSTAKKIRNFAGSELASAVAFATWNVEAFDGGGNTFVLSEYPGSINNLTVVVDGLTLAPVTDFNLSSNVITTVNNTPAGTGNVVIRWGEAIPESATSDAMSLTITPNGTNTNQVSLFEFLEHWPINPMSYMSPSQKTSVKAFNFAVDIATPFMQAVSDALSSSRKIVCPPGGYLVPNGLDIVVQTADRDRSLIIEGCGYGEAFVMTNVKGTIIKSTGNVPVLKVSSPSMPASAGTLQVRNISFDANSDSSAIYLKSFYGQGEFCFNKVRQRGVGHGIQIDYMATSIIHDNYILNKDWATFGLGAARVGYGIWLNLQYDAGLQTFFKNTSRGWLTPIRIGQGGGSASAYSASVFDCESSVSYNGIHCTSNARATRVSHNYLEGGEGGVGLWDEGDYNTIEQNFTFAGFGTHLKSDLFTYGGVYRENRLSAGSSPNQTLCSITSSSASGGPGKVLAFNTFIFGGSGGSVAGVVALRKQGTDPRIHEIGNAYNPRGAWTGGAGTAKIVDTSTGGNYGLTQGFSSDGSVEYPILSRGAISLATEAISLSQSNVSGGVLTLIGAASSFSVNASSAVSVTSISATGVTDGRIVIFDTSNANMTFQDSASLILAGSVNFTGPGLLTLLLRVISGSVFAKEISRTVY